MASAAMASADGAAETAATEVPEMEVMKVEVMEVEVEVEVADRNEFTNMRRWERWAGTASGLGT